MTAALTLQLEPLGLMALGAMPVGPDDGLGDFRTLVLIGPDEPAFWPIFTTSPEYQDTQPNSMDRWSQRVLEGVATQASGQALYPFGGPPYQPFYGWALRTGRFWASPIGFLVHDVAGLFVSMRGAILLPDQIATSAGTRPCDTCPGQPCETACPVDAFAGGYDVDACKTHLHKPAGADCMTKGCAARRACPVGQGNRLPAQANFHMDAFL